MDALVDAADRTAEHDVGSHELPSFAAIVAPCNLKGYKMVPDRASSEAVVSAHPGRFWASEITAGGSVPLAEALAAQRARGAAGCVVGLREIVGDPAALPLLNAAGPRPSLPPAGS